jgi:hypothetical protein
MPFDRGDRTYYVSDERLKTFKALSTLEKLRWQEEIATFILLTRETSNKTSPVENAYGKLGRNLDTDKIIESLRGKVE